MMASVFAMLWMLFPPAGLLSSAVVGLVTLRKGAVEGALTFVMAALACAVLAQLVMGNPGMVAGVLLLMWMPVWALTILLRYSRSLVTSLYGALVLGILVVAAQFFLTQDPVLGWSEALEPLAQSLHEAKMLEGVAPDEVISVVARWMPGVVAMGVLLQSMISLFIARWWQATLYNPGGFQQEFRQIRLSWGLGIVTVVLVPLGFSTGGEVVPWAAYLVLLLAITWFIAGLALVHAVVAMKKASVGWLIGMYIMLLFALPHMVLILGTTAIFDAWFNLRARLKPG
ncbi:MAG: hypothetical protein GY696_31670 [Gammaproteobacteria bacterium]|nr:hypothetical protein [Gammaproteobacteria bacterium]